MIFTDKERLERQRVALMDNCLAPNCYNCGGNKLKASGNDVKVGFLHGEWDLSTFKLTCSECGWEVTGDEAWRIYID